MALPPEPNRLVRGPSSKGTAGTERTSLIVFFSIFSSPFVFFGLDAKAASYMEAIDPST
jgi:hypothetical protein